MPSAKPSLNAMAAEAKTKKKSPAPKKTTKRTPPPLTFKSTEYIQESDEEEEENSDDWSDSDKDSLPENPTNAATKTNGKLPAPSGSESSSESESEEEEDEQNNTARKVPVESEPSRQRPKEPKVRTVAFEKPPPYKPPTGFEAASINENPSASQLLKKSSLKGKQIWYFTAPASIPISEIEQMSMLDADAGEAILNHEGSDYGFVQDTTGDKVYTKIMVPSDSDDAYLTTSKPIDRILHLQQIVKLPGINDSGASVSSPSRATVPAKKPVRPQPIGLKMRFRPIGFGAGDTGNIGDGSSTGSASDEEKEDAPAVFQRPALEDEEMEVAPPSSKSKSKSSTSESSKKEKKEKKRKHTEEETQPAKQSSSQPTNDLDNRELKRPKKKQKKSASRTNNQSVSTEALDTATKSDSQKAKQAALTPDAMSSPTRPKFSQLLGTKGSQESRSPSQKDSKKRPHDSEKTSEERSQKSKKLKHKDFK
ncbi:hypothetical protein BDZ45DRAFT_720299 [Acephala macrosclerotiorum]|nr:hypothetical protein BDZ45DRAFT_720299 [Acephala macrosclerotiorum]